MRFAWNTTVSITSCIGKDNKKHDEGWGIIVGGREYRSMTHGWSMDVDRHIVVLYKHGWRFGITSTLW